MVDKIDRPEAPPTWRVKEAKRTQDDRPSHQQQESSEKKKEKFEKRSEGKWQKFDGRTLIIKPMRIPLRDIKGILFRNAYSNPSCAPTRSLMLTGEHAFRTGIGTTGIPPALKPSR